MRHGETAWNAQGRIQGQLDVPLSEAGRRQAHAVARALERSCASGPFAALYSSDLLRVRQSAAPVSERLSLPVLQEAALRERHYGSFQTITYKEAARRFPDLYARFRARDPEFDFAGGESLRSFAARVQACVARIAARHPGAAVLLFTHGGVLDVVHRRATGKALDAPRDFDLPNAALNWIEISGAAWRLLAWGERAHLSGTLDELPL